MKQPEFDFSARSPKSGHAQAPAAIIEKIKKLLRMKRGGTEAEIDTALNLARDLAAKHGIELASVNPDEHSEPRAINQVDALMGSRIPWESKYAALVCKHFFNVGFIVRSPGWRDFRLTFYGTSVDIQIALYVYHFLEGHFRRAWPFAKKRARLRNRQAFLWGMYIGLCRKLRAQQEAAPAPDSNALMIVNRELERREQYALEHWPNAKETSTEPDDAAGLARHIGFIAGQMTEINKGLNQGKTSLRPALPA